MIKFGFSLDDVRRLNENDDVRLLSAVCSAVEEIELNDSLLLKLIIADAVNHGYVGSQGGSTHGAAYRRWISETLTKMNKINEVDEVQITSRARAYSAWSSVPRRGRRRF